MSYPARDPCYAHRLTRLLFKSCAAQSIGQDAVLLIIHIAHTEDAARYQGPVRFWNSQLNEVLGFRSPKSLNNARRKAVEAGWLYYDRVHDRADGRYWTIIPTRVLLFDDEPIEPLSIPSTEQKAERELDDLGRNWNGKRNGKRNRKVTGTDPLPNPVPNPISVAQVDEQFIKLWNVYPARNGRKLGKPEALAEFQKINPADYPLLMDSVAELVKSEQLPKDCFRWLSNDKWREWIPSDSQKEQILRTTKAAGRSVSLLESTEGPT